MHIHRCDTCGALGTNSARDMTDVTEPGDVWRRLEPRGAIKMGCDLHDVISKTYTKEGRVIVARVPST